jgi:hypothetical protein
MDFRRIFFYILVLLFFILLPLILLYALGYRWDGGTRSLTRTGLIALKTVPPGAEIYLGNKKFKEKTPANIALVPGVYEITLNLGGYWPYSKRVEVQANKVSRLEHILLFSKIPNIRLLAQTEGFEAFFLSPGGKRFFLIRREGGVPTVYLNHLGDKTLYKLASLPPEKFLFFRNLKVNWSLDEEEALFFENHFFYFLSLREPAESFSLESVLGFNPDQAKFSRKRPSSLYFLKDGKLSTLDLKKKDIQPLALGPVADFEPARFGLIGLKAGSSTVFSADEEGNLTKPLGRLKNFKKHLPLFWRPSPKPFLSFEREKWAALDGAGNFYVLNPSFYHAAVQGFRFSPTGEKILFWTKDELWVLKEEPLEALQAEGKAKFSRQLVYESEIPIQGAFWSSDENYAFFMTHRKIYALELNTQGGTNLYPYYASKAPFFSGGWAVDEPEGVFYWIGDWQASRHLRALRLSLGFLEPLVSQMKEMQRGMDSWKEKFQKESA